MSNSNILVENFVKLGVSLKQKQKKRTSTKVSKRSITRSDKKVSKLEPLAIDTEANLMKFETFQLERTSTPNHINLCEHCKHSHAKECCLYIYDDYSDIMKYSSFKHHVEEPYFIVDNDENFHMKIGRTTPKHFPTFTENDSTVADMKMMANVAHPPIVYLRQYLWPIYMPQYPHLANDQYMYHPNNYIYYPHLNIPSNLPPSPYLPSYPMKQAPMASDLNVDFRHYYNSHPNNYVPMNFNNFWV